MDALFVIGFLCLLLVPFIVYKLWWWVGTLAIIAIILGSGEGISALITGRTLSQEFWKLSQENQMGAMIITICITIAWIFLLCHLNWKIMTK
jgi:fluoride ion exporter CrcB/FEX